MSFTPGRGGRTQGPSRVGERLQVTVGPVAHGGHCVARHEGQVIFVRHALPGEEVIVQVTEGRANSRFLRADAVQVLNASGHRVSPPCPFSGPGRCGGCDWQHADAAYTRELKAQVVREQLQRLAGITWDGDVEPLPGRSDGLRWRTRVEAAIDRQHRAGLRAHRSHRVVPVDDCLIAVEQVPATGVFDGTWPRQVTGADVVVPAEGEPVIVPLPVTDAPPVVTELVRTRSYGEHRFAVDARGFWQVHPAAAGTFVQHVMDELAPVPGERVADLYCGVGTFGAFLADAVGPDGVLVGVESDETAVRHADENLAGWDPRLVLGDVQQVLSAGVVAEELGSSRADLVVLDPPRTGAGRRVMGDIARLSPRAVAYVACDPAALARDLRYAAQAGYELESLRAFDAFPMTHHVECIAVLRRQSV